MEGDEQTPSIFGTDSNLAGKIEAFLLTSDEPLDVEAIKNALPQIDTPAIREAVEALQDQYNRPERGIHIESVAGGYQFRTNPAFRDDIVSLYEAKPVELSTAAREALAIIAYQQPITRAEVEEVRGVHSSGVIRKLIEYQLVEKRGKLDDIGQPHLYGTTDRFLELYGLDDLEQLPALSRDELTKLRELYRDKMEDSTE